ncbi:MAG: ester cyclase [bacterium]
MNKSISQFSMICFLAMALCFIGSCQNQAGKADLEEMKAQAKVEAQNKALVQRILAEGDKKNLGILDEVCTPDYKFRFPSNAKPINREQHKELWQAFNVAFPDLTHTIEEIYADEDIVVARETLRGTHKGEFSGIPPTGKKVEFSAVAIYRFSNGKLAEFWVDADLLGLYQQLGMELKPKETEK